MYECCCYQSAYVLHGWWSQTAYKIHILFTCRSSTFQMHGTSYSKNDVVVLGFVDDEPCFGVIHYLITTIDSKYYIVLYSLHVIGYSNHFHSYQVLKTTSLIVCNPDSLVDHHPLSLYKNYETPSQYYYVPLKYHLFPH